MTQVVLAKCILIILLLAGSPAAAQQLKLRIDLDLGQQLSTGAVLLQVESGEALPVSKSVPIQNTSRIQFEVDGLSPPPAGSLLFVYGKVLNANQEPVAYIPVRQIDPQKEPRADLISKSLIAYPTPENAFEASFPFVPSFRASIEETSVSAALRGLKIVLIAGWVRRDTEWERFTSDILLYLPPRIYSDSAQAAGALRFLDEFVEIANDPKYDGFYVDFLLRLKEADIGGISLGPQTLDSFTFAALEKMFSTRIGSTFSKTASALRIFREQSSQVDSVECVAIGLVIANAISGSIESGAVDVRPTSAGGAEALSFMQKMSECAQQYYVDGSGLPTASRLDVDGASRFLVGTETGADFVKQYVRLFELLEPLGHFPRRPVGNSATRRVEVAKYYDNFVRALGG